ncbi:MAG: hypothetical protein J5882_06405 [Bacteroidales bacterium]|nr:hypothetical protein [Bacteroidales bacterium]
MKELINNELAQLQKDLENLQSAAKQISNAGEASASVIEEAKNIQNDFSKNLEKLTTLYTQYLDQAQKASSERNDEIINHFKKTISEQTVIMDKYGALVSTINENSKKLIESSQENQKATVEKLVKFAQEKVDSQDSLLKKAAADTTQKVEAVKSSYLKQAEETDKLLKAYLELAQSTEELKQNIDKVDFPQKFEKLSGLVNNLSNEQKGTSERLEKLEKTGTDSNKKLMEEVLANQKSIRTVKVLAWIILIIAILSTAGIVYASIKTGIYSLLY